MRFTRWEGLGLVLAAGACAMLAVLWGTSSAPGQPLISHSHNQRLNTTNSPRFSALGINGAAGAAGSITFGGDTTLTRDGAANTLAVKASPAANSTFRIYNGGTGTAYIEFSPTGGGDPFITASGAMRIGSTTSDILYLLTGGSNRWQIHGTNGALLPSVDATDLGAAGNSLKRIYVDYTNTATVGAVTINKAAMRVNIAAGGTSVVVTNSLVTAASHVLCVASTNDTTARVTAVVPAAGSFTLYTPATTAQTSFDCFVVNAD